jgi:hypothetical protein
MEVRSDQVRPGQIRSGGVVYTQCMLGLRSSATYSTCANTIAQRARPTMHVCEAKWDEVRYEVWDQVRYEPSPTTLVRVHVYQCVVIALQNTDIQKQQAQQCNTNTSTCDSIL